MEHVDNRNVQCFASKTNRLAHVRYIKILTWLRGLSDKTENFSRPIVSKYPEETWAQRKPNQVQKNDQKASESC